MRLPTFFGPASGVLVACAACWTLPVAAAPGEAVAAAARPLAPVRVAGLGTAVDPDGLDGMRGGDGVELDLVENTARNTGEVVDNHAENILSGSNTLSGDAFSSASGINTAIQNSGSNVLIQNATVVNVQFADPGP